MRRARVFKDVIGFYCWECDCGARGGSVFWEVAHHQADEHVREEHKPKLSRDTPTPPGGVHYDWSDTGMHLTVREDEA